MNRVHPRIRQASVLAGLLASVWSGAAFAQDTYTFPKGSLIIPMNASFQSPCGTISAYGLVWRILQSNQKDHYNAGHPVTVYWVINPTKTSPNRCVPTNTTTAPTPNSPGNTTPNHWDDPWWNDGCDVRVQNNTQMPVVKVDYTSTFPSSGVYPVGNIDLFDTMTPIPPSTVPPAIPGFPAQTVNDSGGGAGRFTTVQYQGGPFVIDAVDAANVINFLKNGDIFVPVAELSRFTTPCTCTGPSTVCHYVQMHQSTVEFTAVVGKRMSSTPPKIAVLDSGAGVKYCISGFTCGTAEHVLDTYLKNAGLYYVNNVTHTSAGGCPEGSRSNCSLNGSVPGPAGTKYPGVIYDMFDAYTDLISTATNRYGLLNRTDVRGDPLYRVFWTPHWETNSNLDYFTGANIAGPDITSVSPTNGPSYSTYVPNGDGAATQRQNALNNVAYFLDRTGSGMMAECASVSSYEGDSRNSLPAYSTRTQFLFSGGIDSNEITYPYNGRNCTDPNYASGQCVLYPNPTNPFAQVGDNTFAPNDGFMMSFGNRTAGAYKPGINRLAVTWKDYVTGDYPANVTRDPQNGWDLFALGFKDNDPQKAAIVYIAGHQYASSVVGNRIVLNTLMNLGYVPTGAERALTAPIVYDDPNGTDAAGTRALLFTATYSAVSGYPPGSDTFDQATGSRWVFPLTPGHLTAHSLIGGTALASNENNLDAAITWEADTALPPPAQRNLFTYFGGEVLAGGALPIRAPHDVRQVNWVPERVAGTALANVTYPAANGGCVDVMKYGTTRNGTFGMIRGSDGMCDLQQATTFSTVNAGDPMGTVATRLQTDLSKVKQMLQVVRGYCFSTSTRSDGSGTPNYEPADGECNNGSDDNRARLGGFVHSTPSLVAPSSLIQDSGAPRPTVIYAGGYDGQLHAFYVSGGFGYTGPAAALTYPNPDATALRPTGDSVFTRDFASEFAGGSVPPPGTELWSFIPPSQLAMLRSNNARVDASPVVFDAFVDMTGTGLREWHTILIATVGTTGREVFALDVTNPLKPVLLWDLVGSVYRIAASYPPFSPVVMANDAVGGTHAFKWYEPKAFYALPPRSDNPSSPPGRADVGLYDYKELGGSKALAAGQLRAGLEPVYGIFVTSNASGATSLSKGIEVFAVEAATGQKLWHWEQPYTNAWADNTVPSGATLVHGTDGVRRLLVGDMEGRLWELDAVTGQNVNNLNAIPGLCPSPPCNFAAFDTESTAANPQPITTNIAVGKVPPSGVTGALAQFPAATVIAFGTAGADWVPAAVSGKLHVLLYSELYRVPVVRDGVHLDGTSWTQASAVSYARTHGVMQEAGTSFPVALTNPGERMYGNITVAGQTLLYATAVGPIGDIMMLGSRTVGSTYSIDMGAAAVGAPASRFPLLNQASYGGMAVLHRAGATPDSPSTDYVVGLESNKITLNKVSNSGPTGAISPNPALNPRGLSGILYQLKAWMQRQMDSY